MNALSPIDNKVAALIPRLASDKDGEVVATARAIGRQLNKAGSDWHDLAARLGWDEVDLFGISPTAPWARLDRKRTAFGGAAQAITAEAVTYIGGQRRFKARVNNDNGAVPIWELAAGSNPSNGGYAA